MIAGDLTVALASGSEAKTGGAKVAAVANTPTPGDLSLDVHINQAQLRKHSKPHIEAACKRVPTRSRRFFPALSGWMGESDKLERSDNETLACSYGHT